MIEKELFEKYKKYVCPICANKDKELCEIRITTGGEARCVNYERKAEEKK